MKRVLVTGASGFIGRQALPLLTEKGYDVHAVSLNTSMDMPKVNWHKADLLLAADRRRLMEKIRPTHILHFAWIATPGIYWTSPLNQNWHDATLDLLALSQAMNATRFVGAGSCAEYDWSIGNCDEELTALLPATPYGKAKAECGKAVMDTRDNISTAWGRIFLLYGPYEHPKRLVSSVILSLLRNEPAKCTHGKQLRDFLHVTDVASAFVALLDSNVRGAINIASGQPICVADVVSMIGEMLGKQNLIELGAIASQLNDPPILTAQTHRLQQEVGWKPLFSLATGLNDTINWWKSR